MVPLRTAYLMIGVPGSGKSFVRDRLMQQDQYLCCVCPDDVRQELWGNAMDQAHNPETWGAVHADIARTWMAERDVIVDATHVTEGSRRERVAFLRRLGYHQVIAIVLLTPYELCVQRNAGRDRTIPVEDLSRMYDSLVASPPDESLYDDVWYIAPSH